jgi:peptide/nickel transport system ATP-binding protein
MALVEVVAVSKSYPRRVGLRTAEQTVVENLSLKIEAGETLGLVGESGSGKTTVARMILGLTKPTSGTIRVDGVDLASASAAGMHRLRRQMQPVFQDPFAALNPRMKVLEIVTEPLIIHRQSVHRQSAENHQEDSTPDAGRTALAAGDPTLASGCPTLAIGDPALNSGCPTLAASLSLRLGWGNARERAELRAKAVELLGKVGLDESALGRYPHEFSGGQRQRINIARALALRPRLLVLDEPVSALDVSVGAQIVNLLRGLQREHGLTYLFISHSMPLVRYLSTRIAVMERGRLVESGEAEEICLRPREAYTRQLIAATPELGSSVA